MEEIDLTGDLLKGKEPLQIAIDTRMKYMQDNYDAEEYAQDGMILPASAMFFTEERKLVHISIPLYEDPDSAHGMTIDQQKDMVTAMLRKLADDMKAIRYVFMSEAWMSQKHADDLKDQDVTPREDPNRQNVLMILEETIMTSQTHIYRILTNAEDLELEFMQKHTNDNHSGAARFCNVVYKPSRQINAN